ncbi:MAG: TetR/AcrR family transcriptional regulator [Kofleriaceae bacterium]|nr:TetR/AcrR family transcriptional regulator [Kofleriaceae bacterium]MCL4228684.1 TetR/AcrR family transcriptional regulator [Myxococcales bacterium]
MAGRSSVPAEDVRAIGARAERRRQILDAAKQVFAEAGYHGASIHAIIERAAIARGTFYLYFESKEAVFGALLDEAMTELRHRIVRIDTGPGARSPKDQLEDSLSGLLAFVVADRPLATVLLSSSSTPDAEAAARLAGFYAEVRQVIALSLETGMQIGLIRRCHPERTAAALLGLVRGIVEHCVTRPVDQPLDQPIADVTRELIDLALVGVLAR